MICMNVQNPMNFANSKFGKSKVLESGETMSMFVIWGSLWAGDGAANWRDVEGGNKWGAGGGRARRRL